ncbi:Type IV prepilin peptidase TadV/CpaA [hydrothermal vent metagenome]|uniref:Type IV prepilin peptidase TadV/CpaA n=1 Tax=hydrothermal vent metagenome TaxID=652676 RepID=A0A3B0WTF0_9ZZZZ
MNMLALMIFPIMMAFAASSDLLTMRISNKIVMFLILGFVVLATIIGMPLSQFLVHLGIAFTVLIVSFGLFTFGWIGGGDAKLAAASALWFGSSITLTYLIYASLLGGLLTIVLIVLRKLPLPIFLMKVTWVERLHNKISGIPYGIALAAAGLLVYPQSVIFAHFAG